MNSQPIKIKWHVVLIYVSLIFLMMHLYRQNYLNVPEIRAFLPIGLSFVCLAVGFLLEPFTWRWFLNQAGIRISWQETYAATGTTVFTKYIPGKFMSIVGRAAYVSGSSKHALGDLVPLTFVVQLVALWVSLSLGIISLFSIAAKPEWVASIVVVWLLLSVSIFTPLFPMVVQRVAMLLLKRKVTCTHLSIKQAIQILPLFFIYWFTWGLGFYLLVAGMTGNFASFYLAFVFPLSTAFGIVALISPGGLGVREGVLAFYLIAVGIDTETATTLAVTSRLWFLMGESFSFIVGFAARSATES